MDRFKVLLRLRDMFGESVTLNQAIEIVERAIFTIEVLEGENHAVDVDLLLTDLTVSYLYELEFYDTV
jgi:hypothetical protein